MHISGHQGPWSIGSGEPAHAELMEKPRSWPYIRESDLLESHGLFTEGFEAQIRDTVVHLRPHEGMKATPVTMSSDLAIPAPLDGDAEYAGKVSDPSAQLSLGPRGGGKATVGASIFGWLNRGLTEGFLAQTNRICDWVSGTDLVGSDLSNHGENLGPHGDGKVMPTMAKIKYLQYAEFRNLRLNLDLTIQSMGEKSTGTAGRLWQRQYTAAVLPSAHQCSGSSFPGTNLIFWMGH